MTGADVLIVLVLLGSTIIGLLRGFVREAVSLVFWVAAVWAAWKYVVPGATSGLAYDGLVWCEDHWSWFPRPYRVLRDLLNEPAQ